MLLMFGKNLKKIRSVKGMSQQEFADIFDLKRGTLGAYEEGRSNPKLETVIKIANHFSIGLEELLVSELTVNKLLNFNERLTVENDSYNRIEFDGIPCVMPADKYDFIKKYVSGADLEKLSKIKLPYINSEDRIAFAVDDLAMTGGPLEFFPKDIIVGARSIPASIDDKSLVVVLTKAELLFRRFFTVEGNFILKADHHGVEDLVLTSEDIISIWKIEHIFNFGIHAKEILYENRFAVLEQSIEAMQNRSGE